MKCFILEYLYIGVPINIKLQKLLNTCKAPMYSVYMLCIMYVCILSRITEALVEANKLDLIPGRKG